jgi:hypothetical protein
MIEQTTERVVFNERRHTYSLDGRYCPGVTTILNKAIGKPFLIAWAARTAAQWCATNAEGLASLGEQVWIETAAKAPDRVRDAGGDLGRQLHTVAERLVYGEPVGDRDDDGTPLPPEVLDMAGHLARFLDARGVEPVVHEAIVFHQTHWWAGRLDLIADMGDGRRWLLDYKTAASGVRDTDSLQLAAYRHASHIQIGGRVLLMPPTDEAAVVWVRPDGVQLVPVNASEAAYGRFLHCAAVAEWVTKEARDSVGAPLPDWSEGEVSA